MAAITIGNQRCTNGKEVELKKKNPCAHQSSDGHPAPHSRCSSCTCQTCHGRPWWSSQSGQPTSVWWEWMDRKGANISSKLTGCSTRTIGILQPPAWDPNNLCKSSISRCWHCHWEVPKITSSHAILQCGPCTGWPMFHTFCSQWRSRMSLDTTHSKQRFHRQLEEKLWTSHLKWKQVCWGSQIPWFPFTTVVYPVLDGDASCHWCTDEMEVLTDLDW